MAQDNSFAHLIPSQNDPWAPFRVESEKTSTQGNPFAHLIPSQEAPSPGPIYGPAATTIQQNADKRADSAEARARRDQQLQEDKFRRDQQEWQATHNPDGTPKKDEFGNEAQQKASGFYGRMEQAEREWLALPDDAKSPRGLVRQAMHASAPDLENTFLNSNERQRADQAVENFIAAQLRLESGAAISPAEFDRQYHIFFPMPGDGNEVIAQKARARAQAIDAMKIAAGPLADKARATLQPVEGQPRQDQGGLLSSPSASGGPSGGSGPGGGINTPDMRGGLPVGTGIKFGMDGGDNGPFNREEYLQKNFGINADQEAKALAFLNANLRNPGLTPDAIKGWYQQNGIPAPSQADLDRMAQDAQKGVQFQPINTSEAEKAYLNQLQMNLDKEGYNPTSAGAYASRALTGAELGLSDEIEGIGGAVKNALSDKGLASGYIEARDTARLAQEQARQKQGLLGYATEFGGGLVPGLATGGAGSAIKTSATLGGIAGYGYGQGLGGSALGAATGAGLGAALGAGGQKLTDMALARQASRVAAPASDGAQVIQAADNLNAKLGTSINPMPADVAGPGIRNVTGGAAKFPLSAQPIVKGAQKVTQEAEKARDAIASLVGKPTELETAGEAALNGAQKFIQSSRSKVNALYDKARQLGGQEPVDLVNARAALDRNVAELEQTPGGAAGLSELKALRAQLDQAYPVEGVKNMRTQLRDKFMQDGLRGSDLERRIGTVLDAAETDIVDSLNAAGKAKAATAYADAAAAHKERVQLIDTVLSPIIGAKGSAPRSGEEIMAALNSATQRNNARLGRFMNALPAEDAATVRATVISRLGAASKGQQNAEGTAFSLPQFLTQWNAMTPGAKRSLFSADVRSSLDDLAKVAGGTKEAQRFANFSNTGSALGLATSGAAATGIVAHPFLTISGALAQYGGGRLLASPAFARWLARLPQIKPSAMPNYIRKLSSIAAAEGGALGDIEGLQNYLMSKLDAGKVEKPGKLQK
ncbi:MAG: hypothetical protein J0H39_25640 [Alphaproteobacteria bacterium]|uniref:hypothetical protein n=1 Tax=unclassified Novosphingobium TaxID=2644732 RepID=UPI001AC298FB|nr:MULTISPECIES: hypothetical protein [unclassified Novosphingobium]MBN9146583.1 hypothetical protein [Novosphingobium sp.]MBN9500148.1 hypothetical protein [Alphaproteobacteria bacterium]